MSEGLAAVAGAIAEATGLRVASRPASQVSGGSRDEAWRWPTRGGELFVKLAPAPAAERLAGEAAGLAAIGATEVLRVPAVFGHGATSTTAWLALEWLELSEPAAAAETALGEALASLHGCTAAPRRSSASRTTTSSAAARRPMAGWRTASRSSPGAGSRRSSRSRPRTATARSARLIAELPSLCGGYRPAPALLHGDLRAGNRGMLVDATPVEFDPASHYGDREANLAMTKLFGGFGASFYAAYRAAWPLEPGFEARQGIHTLYHVLNHLNLFGRNYLAQARALIDRLLAATGH